METIDVNKYLSIEVNKNMLKNATSLDDTQFELIYQSLLDSGDDFSLANTSSAVNNQSINSNRLDSIPINLINIQDIILSARQARAETCRTTVLPDSLSETKFQSNSLDTCSNQSDLENIYQAVDKYSKEFGIDKNLILSIIKQESNFSPSAESEAGAMGVMQLMGFNCESLGVTNPFDIEQNIRGGTALLKSYLDMYNGNIEMALMAYNGGPGTMQNREVSSPSDLYKMPLETQNYVPNVLNYYKEYSEM